MDEIGGPARIKISGPAGLLAAVPGMLGFHPSDSLVLMCMNGERSVIGPVARVDLPSGRDRGLVGHLIGTALTHADRVAIVCYPRRRRRPAVLGELIEGLTAVGIDVIAALVVHGGRVWEAPGPRPLRLADSQPVPGEHHPAAQAFAAANAMLGRVVLTDRAQLRASVAGPLGDRRRLAARAVAAVIQGRPVDLTRAHGRSPGAGTARDGLRPPVALAPLPERVDRLVDCALDQVVAGGVVDVEVAVELAIACLDRDVRDGVIARGLFELDRDWLAMLISCAGWTTDDLAAGICAVLATVAYRHGDGGLAQVSVDRCLAAEPENRLVHLLVATMEAGLPPEALDRLLVPPDDELGSFDEDGLGLNERESAGLGLDGFDVEGFDMEGFDVNQFERARFGLLDSSPDASADLESVTAQDDDDAVA